MIFWQIFFEYTKSIYCLLFFIDKMRKVGSIYLKGQNKENVSLAVDIPTRRKESMDATSVHTQASYKEASGYQIKSTSINSRSCSQCNSFDQAEDTLRE